MKPFKNILRGGRRIGRIFIENCNAQRYATTPHSSLRTPHSSMLNCEFCILNSKNLIPHPGQQRQRARVPLGRDGGAQAAQHRDLGV